MSDQLFEFTGTVVLDADGSRGQGRPGNLTEIVTTALMLASPASSYTTCALPRIDGGQR